MADMSLADLLELTKDGEWGQGEPSADTTSMLVIRGTDFGAVRRGDISSVPIRHISSQIAERKRLRPGDILIETAGGTKDQPTGRTVLLKDTLFHKSSLPFACASFSRFLRVKRDLIRPEYLFWYLQYLYSSGEMYPFHVQHTGVARFQYTQFARATSIPSPPFDIQDGVIELLGALDDKIEANRQMNETLEAMAQSVFNDWFVDFGPTRAKIEGRARYLASDLWEMFPDRLDVEGRPEGWQRHNLGDVTDISIGRTPPRGRHDCFTTLLDAQPWLSIRDMGAVNVFAYDSSERLTEQAIAEFRVPMIPPETVIVRFKMTVGRVAITTRAMTSNEAIAHLKRVKEWELPVYFLYCFMSQFDYSRLSSTSSIVNAVNSESIRAIQILLPSRDLRLAFESQVSPLFERLRANIDGTAALGSIRDLLLPKLMTGEMSLKSAEEQMREVV